MNYLITMKDGWKPGECKKCHIYCHEESKDCPLADAKEAVEVSGGISRAIATQFDKEVKLFAVREKE